MNDRSTNTDFPAVVLKGIIEHQDAASYFGATGALGIYRDLARARGWLDEKNEPTEAGRAHYNTSGLEKLPKIKNRRAYFWDWSCYTAPPPSVVTIRKPAGASKARSKSKGR